MTTDETDNALQPLFRELRTRDGQRAPPFARVTDRVRPLTTATAAPGTPWLRFAVGATAFLVVLCLTLALIRVGVRRRLIQERRWAALSEWRSSTDVLLVAANTPWSTNVATFSDSWITGTAAVPDTTSSDRKENQ